MCKPANKTTMFSAAIKREEKYNYTNVPRVEILLEPFRYSYKLNALFTL